MEERVGYSIERPRPQRRALALTHRRLTVLLIAYGLAVAAIGAVQLHHSIHGADAGLNSERQQEMFASFDVLDGRGPPLTGLSGDRADSFYPLAVNDDRGAFIYLPVVGHMLGTHDLALLLKWFFILFFVPLVALYPLVIHRVTDSVVAACASPWLLLHYASFVRESGIFWVPAWADLLLLPLVLLAARRWKPSLLWPLVALALVASFATSMRANAGVGFAIGAGVLVLMRMPTWRTRLVGAALILVAYLSIGSFAMHAVQVQRDVVVGHDFTSPYVNGHPFWHNAYIGLGYLKNPYGFRPTDASAIAAAHRQDPGAPVKTKRYERALRTIYFNTLRHHPWFVVDGWLTKARVEAGLAVHWFPGAVLLAPLLLLFGRGRRARQFDVLLIAGAGLAGALTGIVTLPTKIPEIQSGWYAFLLLLWILCIGWVCAPLEARVWSAVRRLPPALATRYANRDTTLPWIAPWAIKVRLRLALQRLRSIGAPGRTPRAARARAGRLVSAGTRAGWIGRAAVAACLVAALYIADTTGNATDATAAYWANETPLTNTSAIHGTVVKRWSFAGGVPAGWRATVRGLDRRDGDLIVRTRASTYGRQLTSPTRVLSPGTYLLSVQGRVLRGGLQLGAVDHAAAERTISYTFFWDGQDFRPSHRMALAFDLAEPTAVNLILSNFSVAGHSSSWELGSVELRREAAACRLDTPYAWFTPSPAEVGA